MFIALSVYFEHRIFWHIVEGIVIQVISSLPRYNFTIANFGINEPRRIIRTIICSSRIAVQSDDCQYLFLNILGSKFERLLENSSTGNQNTKRIFYYPPHPRQAITESLTHFVYKGLFRKPCLERKYLICGKKIKQL